MVASGDIAQLVIPITGPAGTMLNVLGFEAVDGTATFDGLASSFNTNDLAGFMQFMRNTFTCTELRVEDVKPGTAATHLFQVTPTKAGTNSTSEALPPQSALVISWRTPLKGRSFRGRTYMGGLCESDQNVGDWSSALIAAIDTWTDNFLARYAVASPASKWRFGIISRVSAGLTRAVPILTHVDGALIDGSVFTQRRRGKGRR